MLRILVACDQQTGASELRSLISAHPGWKLCGEAGAGEAYELARRKRPDIVIIDVGEPLVGLSLVRLLCEDMRHVRCLLYTIHEDEVTAKSAVAAGVQGYVLKREGEPGLVIAINRLGEGGRHYSPDILEAIAGVPRSGRRPVTLTPRELALIRLLAEGYTKAKAAGLLGISVRTAESHCAAAMRKAGVRSTPELIRTAIQLRLIAGQ